jgi:hypothetical protein
MQTYFRPDKNIFSLISSYALNLTTEDALAPFSAPASSKLGALNNM